MILRPFGRLRAQELRKMAGATLLEILIAMLIIGLVATGIITAFIFGRRVTWRSSTELSSSGLVTETAEALRGAINGPLANGLSLQVGIYVDQHMDDAGGFIPAGATQLAALNLWNNPTDPFKRFQVDKGTAATLSDHGDGRLVVVEGAADLDGDGAAGLDLNGDTLIDLRRVRVRVKWTSPAT